MLSASEARAAGHSVASERAAYGRASVNPNRGKRHGTRASVAHPKVTLARVTLADTAPRTATRAAILAWRNDPYRGSY